jgi:hypothetical protein
MEPWLLRGTTLDLYHKLFDQRTRFFDSIAQVAQARRIMVKLVYCISKKVGMTHDG